MIAIYRGAIHMCYVIRSIEGWYLSTTNGATDDIARAKRFTLRDAIREVCEDERIIQL